MSDSSGNNHNGFLGSTSQSDSEDPDRTGAGKDGSGLHFRGSGSHSMVGFDSFPAFSANAASTHVMWLYPDETNGEYFVFSYFNPSNGNNKMYLSIKAGEFKMETKDSNRDRVKINGEGLIEPVSLLLRWFCFFFFFLFVVFPLSTRWKRALFFGSVCFWGLFCLFVSHSVASVFDE